MSKSLPPSNLLYLIPDTCWLLDAEPRAISYLNHPRVTVPLANRLPPILRLATLPLRIPVKLLFSFKDRPRYVTIPATWILLDEVMEEIIRLHDGEEVVGTGNAKNCISQIMQSSCFERHSANNAPKVPLIEGRLGLDSETDHAILSFAVSLSNATPFTRVGVLTNDAGLNLEIQSQRREHGHRIYTGVPTISDGERSSEFDRELSEYLLREHGIGRVI